MLAAPPGAGKSTLLSFLGRLAEEVGEFLSQRCFGIAVCCLQKSLGFIAEGKILLHEFLQFRLSLESDGRSKVALHLKECLVLGVELFLGPLQFCIILRLEVLKVFLHDDVFGHGAEGSIIAEMAETDLRSCAAK